MDNPGVSSASVSARMRRQRRRDTQPELALRRALHARGHRYRVDAALPGVPRRRADLLFAGARVVVFVDGCFWHGCPVHATAPRTNRAWWQEKLIRNIERDRDTDRRLAQLGWESVRVWECAAVSEAVAEVEQVLARRREWGRPH